MVCLQTIANSASAPIANFTLSPSTAGPRKETPDDTGNSSNPIHSPPRRIPPLSLSLSTGEGGGRAASRASPRGQAVQVPFYTGEEGVELDGRVPVDKKWRRWPLRRRIRPHRALPVHRFSMSIGWQEVHELGRGLHIARKQAPTTKSSE